MGVAGQGGYARLIRRLLAPLPRVTQAPELPQLNQHTNADHLFIVYEYIALTGIFRNPSS